MNMLVELFVKSVGALMIGLTTLNGLWGEKKASTPTLKNKATCYSGLSVTFQQTTRFFISEDRISHDYCCENLGTHLAQS
jgi:hypothetical protein